MGTNGVYQELPTRFALGRIVATPGALSALAQVHQEALLYLRRHATGDWGDLDEEDQRENNLSLEHGYRLLSAYFLSDGTKLWITEGSQCQLDVPMASTRNAHAVGVAVAVAVAVGVAVVAVPVQTWATRERLSS